MEIIACRTFSNETVVLDDKHFVDCNLIQCVLEYSGGRLAFESTKITGCQYFFYGHAHRTVEFLQAVGLVTADPADWASLSEVVH